MGKRISIGLFLIVILVFALAAFAACGKGSGIGAKFAGKTGRELAVSFDSVKAELDVLEKPAEVSQDVWDSLKSAFLDSFDSTRTKAAAPSGNFGKVMPELFDPGDGTVEIRWRYRNTGDYDLSGEVGIPDITPIALNYLATVTDPDSILAWIDGDESGEIGIPDVTPIALNYLAFVEGYSIERSDAVGGPYTEIGTVLFGEHNDAPIPGFEFIDGTPPSGTVFYRVTPFHGENFGESSEPLEFVAGTTIDTETTLPELNIAAGERVNVINDAKVHVEGDVVIDGELRGVNGDLWLHVMGNLTVNGKITLDAPDENIPPEDDFPSIILIVEGDTTFSDASSLASDGSVILVSDLGDIPAFDDVFSDADADDGITPTLAPYFQAPGGGFSRAPTPFAFSEFGRSTSQAGRNTVLSGDWVVRTPPRGVKRIVVAVWPNGSDVEVVNFTITGPDGREGASDLGGNPVATGENGGDAMTCNIRVNGGALNINANVTFNLGNGGRGGSAMANGNPDAEATGGDGGQPGKLKFRADNGINISGTFHINPGDGGAGGFAEAYGADGQDGCPAENGGNASAYGGFGASVERVLTARGVTGLGNAEFGFQFGGDGGYALAYSGFGGNDTCIPGGIGGRGGDALADAGDGGDSFLTVTGTLGGTALGGNGGDSFCAEGEGGNGNSFADKTPGGDGGDGGNMLSYAGKGGTGTDGDGNDGTPDIDVNGGHGGDGGDGCGPGIRGLGGGWEYGVGGQTTGTDFGLDGEDGVSTCIMWFFPWDFLSDGQIPGGSLFTEDLFSSLEPPSLEGSMPVEFLDIGGAEYFTQGTPFRHVGFAGPGILRLNVGGIVLNEGAPGDIVGIRYMTAQPMFGIGEEFPLVFNAYDSEMNLIDSVLWIDPNAEIVDIFFDVFTDLSYIDIVPPNGCFITLGGIFIFDP